MRRQYQIKLSASAVFAIAIAFLGIFAAGCSTLEKQFREHQRELEKQASQPPVWSPPAGESVHLALGNPSNAGTSDRDNFLIVGDGHVLSYSNSRGSANWASWRTTAADLGERLERPDFRPDPRLPKGFRRIERNIYSGSGFDRGHLVPSADRFADKRLNEETFYMSNIVPQAGALNRYPWEKLESYARLLVRRGNDANNIAGCSGEKDRIRNRVAVPIFCWKVIVLVKNGRPVTSIDGTTNVIAVDLPNVEGIENDDWRKYRTTVREIERRTGFDLLSALPQELQNEIETRSPER
jgi:endonuclease G, mitochondrial